MPKTNAQLQSEWRVRKRGKGNKFFQAWMSAVVFKRMTILLELIRDMPGTKFKKLLAFIHKLNR